MPLLLALLIFVHGFSQSYSNTRVLVEAEDTQLCSFGRVRKRTEWGQRVDGIGKGHSILHRDYTVILESGGCLEEGLLEAQTSKELAEATERGNGNQTEAHQFFVIQLE